MKNLIDKAHKKQWGLSLFYGKQHRKSHFTWPKTSLRKELVMPVFVKIPLLNSVSTAPLVSPQDEGMSQ
jgi:hypothetical protein